jgi:hypothetical protein
VFEVVLLVLGAVAAVVDASGRLSVVFSAVTVAVDPSLVTVVVPLVVPLLLSAPIDVVTISFLLPQTTQLAGG